MVIKANPGVKDFAQTRDLRSKFSASYKNNEQHFPAKKLVNLKIKRYQLNFQCFLAVFLKF